MAEDNAQFSNSIHRFGVFEVNFAARELRKHGVRIRLHGQPFSILSLLLEKPGEIITRETMRQRLWAADTFVDFEHSLNSSVKKLRAALGDSPDNPRYIETLPRVGYRFIAPVQEIAATEQPSALPAFAGLDKRTAAPSEKWIRRQRLPLGIVAALLIAAAAGYSVWSRAHVRPRPADARTMLAVLPFENLTGDPGQDYFSDGLTEEMIAQLEQLDPQRLGVIARTSVMHYKHDAMPLSKVGRELGVQYVLEGSVRRDLDRVRVSAELVQVRDQTRIWSREYDRQLTSLLVLQGEIAQAIADEIQLALPSGHKVLASERKAVPAPTSYEAYDFYLRGRYFWNKRTNEGFQRAAQYFRQAIAKDPNYARAYAGLADTYALMSSWSLALPGEFTPKARAAALRALQIDSNLAEAHTSLALIAQNYDYDWQTAEQEFRRAIQFDPQYATAHQWYAESLSFQGRFDEAFTESERARQLDPLSLIIATDYAAALYYSRQYDRAIEQFRAVQAMEPDFPRAHMVTFAYVEKGMYTEALAEAGKWHHSDGTPVWEIHAFIYARQGRKRQARHALSKWEQWRKGRGSPTTFAPVLAYVALGLNDEAIALLQKSCSEHSNAVVEIKVAPFYDPLRGDPRFQEILRRVHLDR